MLSPRKSRVNHISWRGGDLLCGSFHMMQYYDAAIRFANPPCVSILLGSLPGLFRSKNRKLKLSTKVHSCAVCSATKTAVIVLFLFRYHLSSSHVIVEIRNSPSRIKSVIAYSSLVYFSPSQSQQV